MAAGPFAPVSYRLGSWSNRSAAFAARSASELTGSVVVLVTDVAVTVLSYSGEPLWLPAHSHQREATVHRYSTDLLTRTYPRLTPVLRGCDAGWVYAFPRSARWTDVVAGLGTYVDIERSSYPSAGVQRKYRSARIAPAIPDVASTPRSVQARPAPGV